MERSTDVTLADATLTISVYIGGIIVGRTALSTHVVGRNDPVWLLRGGLLLTFIGSLLVWLVPSFELAVLAMFVLGLGLGWLYPIAGSITLATAPHLPTLASARLVLASGVAMLSAPFILGLVADVTGVTTAWLLVPAICVASALMTVPVARARAGHRPPEHASTSRCPEGSPRARTPAGHRGVHRRGRRHGPGRAGCPDPAVPDAFSEAPQAPQVLLSDRRRRLDLDARDPSGAILEDEVDLRAIVAAVVGESFGHGRSVGRGRWRWSGRPKRPRDKVLHLPRQLPGGHGQQGQDLGASDQGIGDPGQYQAVR